MSELDLFQSRAVDANITEPRYLIEITLDSKLNLSTSASVTIDGVYWQDGKVRLDGVGQSSASIAVENADYQYTAPAMKGSYTGKPVKIWFAYPYPGEIEPYFEEGYWDEDYFIYPDTVPPIMIFNGVIADITNADEWLSINAERNIARYYPHRQLRPPEANHLPASGQVYEWNGDTYRIA